MTAPQPPQPQYPAPGYIPPPPPPRKRHPGRWIVMALGALVAIIIGTSVNTHPAPPASPTTTTAVPAGNQGVQAPAPTSQAPAAPAVHHVVYEIAGTATSASVTYNSDGSTSIQQDTGARVPWTKAIDVPVDQALSIVQVSAQNGGGGTITCKITVDGKIVKSGTATGEYAIASCDATIQ